LLPTLTSKALRSLFFILFVISLDLSPGDRAKVADKKMLLIRFPGIAIEIKFLFIVKQLRIRIIETVLKVRTTFRHYAAGASLFVSPAIPHVGINKDIQYKSYSEDQLKSVGCKSADRIERSFNAAPII
jgi:hypothetical protein